jgi:hypothetical protein
MRRNNQSAGNAFRQDFEVYDLGNLDFTDPAWRNLPLERLVIRGVSVRPGDRVRLWPRKGADIMDMALKGKTAIIESAERDLDGRVHLGVVLEDDPGRDLGMMRQPGHRFFFSPEEVEPLAPGDEASHGS